MIDKTNASHRRIYCFNLPRKRGEIKADKCFWDSEREVGAYLEKISVFGLL